MYFLITAYHYVSTTNEAVQYSLQSPDSNDKITKHYISVDGMPLYFLSKNVNVIQRRKLKRRKAVAYIRRNKFTVYKYEYKLAY